MRLNKAVEIAINMIAILDNKPKKTQDLADRLQVSKGYTHQVIRKLAKSGLILSLTGQHGGVLRVKRPDPSVSLYDIVESLAPGAFKSDLKDVTVGWRNDVKLKEGENFFNVDEGRTPFATSDNIREQVVNLYKQIKI